MLQMYGELTILMVTMKEVISPLGIGVDWLTPIGPLSFTLAEPLSKANTDKTESFRFNLGTTF